MIRRPPRSTLDRSSAASDVYKRQALGYALTHKLSGLILCGALASADQINAITCPVFAISGMDDFNFMETAQYLSLIHISEPTRPY